MNIYSKSNISKRKQRHIDACKEGSKVQSLSFSGFEEIQFVHNALPELLLDQIKIETLFLNRAIQFPFFISCMTGGTEEGKKANIQLAKAAQKCKIPIGLGSIRILFEDPAREADFSLRSICQDIPILANLGAVQLKNTPSTLIKEWLKRLEVDALVVHLNCGQEIFQSGGDCDFTNLFDAIKKSVDDFSLPIIVKETGFGIRPSIIKKLLDFGVEYVDVAGAGGTNWILVEDKDAKEFGSWGIPTAQLLDASEGKILASGGLRSGMDVVKSVALGAIACGMALPLIQAAIAGGEEKVCHTISHFMHTFKTAMALTGSKTIEDLQKTPLLRSQEHEHLVKQLKQL